MKPKVLLVTTYIYHYRVPIYNYFFDKFKNNNIDFFILANKIQKNNQNEVQFPYRLTKRRYFIKEINNLKPDVIISFLNLSHYVIFPILLYAKFKNIPFIYWAHGINLQQKNNKLKNQFYYFLHKSADSIILYSEEQINLIQTKNRAKIFIANNTINFSDMPRFNKDRTQLKKELNIKFKKTVLFVGRITKAKRVDILINIFKSFPQQYGLIIIGDGLSERTKKELDDYTNIKYYKGMYDNTIINKYFAIADLFCIPGANGLGINQAMYWGVPCITIKGKHSPEIIYIKNGINGYIVNDVIELKEKIQKLLGDEDLLQSLSKMARQHILEDASIDKMFEGFYNAIQYVTKQSNENH